jgi:quinol monooxygenase YgiN
VTLIIAGTVRLPPANVEPLRPHMIQMMSASQAEDGCLTYAYAEDVADPGLIRVFEMWRDQAALDAHFASDHMARWRAVREQYGLSDRKLFAYEVASQRAI